jgi:DNA-binding CsgD family transcriptional regulator
MTTHVRRPVGLDADSVPLIGRKHELATFEELVGDPMDPAGRAVVISGEAGIGKSRLLAHVLESLTATGWTTFDVRADELDHVVPYAGLRHAIVQQMRGLNSELISLAAELVTVLDVAAGQPTESVRSVAAHFFSALTDSRPVVLAFDELARTDEDTIMLVAWLLRQSEAHALVLVGNLRQRSADIPVVVTMLLERLEREQRLSEIELGPLSNAAIAKLVDIILGDLPRAPELTEFVHRLSAGNPLFAIQTMLNLTDTDTLVEPTGVVPDIEFPEVRRRGFLRRVLRVGPQAGALARAVALLGVVGPGKVRLAAELAELSPEQADDAFDSLVERGILHLRDGNGYRVGHDLVREALYQEIGPATRWRWHRLAAERLADLPSSPMLDLEAADHIRHVAETGDERAIAILSRAAERACDAAPQSSVSWYRAALRVVPAQDPRHPQLLARLTRALLLAGRPGEAVDAGLLALETVPAGNVRARLVTRVVDGMVLAGTMKRAAGVVDAELPRAAENVGFMAKAAHIYMGVGRAEEALERAQFVEERLFALSAHERIVALSDLMRMRFVQRRVDELLRLCTMMEDAAQEAAESLRLAAYAVVAYARAGTGETRLASASIGRAQQVLATVGWTLYKNDLASAQVQNAMHLGDWSSALSIIESTVHDLQASGSRMHLGVLRTVEIEVLANRGDWAAARRAVDQPLSGDPHCDAGFHLLSNELDTARNELEHCLERPSLPKWVHALLLSRLAETEIEAGRLRLAADLIADPLGHGDDVIDHPTYVAVRLAHGRATGDISALTEALQVADTHALALQRGQVRLALGALDVDPEVNLTEAARIFQSLGAAPWRQRAVAELRRRGLRLPRQRTRPSGLLTETEEQVVRLVHQRFTNREIASAVFLSVKTVEAYLGRIYVKTGCANRIELARAFESGSLSRPDSARAR